MKIEYTRTAEKDIKKLPKGKRQKILIKLKTLTKSPYLGKKLEGEYNDLRSLRVWPYRIVYEVKNRKIVIYYVKHRQGVYR